MRDAACNRCPLGLALQPDFQRANLCVPMRLWSEDLAPAAPQALLVIGKAPGREEDRDGHCFVGAAGKQLNAWLTALNLKGHVDIYLTNTVRCRLFRDDAPLTKQSIDGCREWLACDLAMLDACYSKVTLLVVGGHAAAALGLGSVRDATRRQGQVVPITRTKQIYRLSRNRRRLQAPLDSRQQHGFTVWLPRVVTENRQIEVGQYPVYATYHPAALLPDRSPALIHAIADHLQLLSDSLLGRATGRQVTDDYLLAAPPPSTPFRLLSLDIETYGAVDTFPEQTVFHPQRSIAVDGITKHQLVQTVSTTALLDDGTEQSSAFIWANPHHRTILKSWLRLIRAYKGALISMNTLFDVSNLRFVGLDPEFRELLDSPLLLEDAAIWNYLNNALRPEKNLEAISRVFGLLPPPPGGTGLRSKKFQRYGSTSDGNLLSYNVKDTRLALGVRKHLRAQLSQPACSEYTRRWYSELLWTCLDMSEAGVAVSPSKLQELQFRSEARMATANHWSEDQGYGPLAGIGSKPTAARIIDEAVEAADLREDPRLKRTKEHGDISTDRNNIQLLLGCLPVSGGDRGEGKTRQAVQHLFDHRQARKLIESYTRPLLGTGKDNKQRLVPVAGAEFGIAYPNWYPAPLEFSGSTGSGNEGGTPQGRITCKEPGLQTSPADLQDCYVSRFRPGALSKYDLSQIELRLAALQSGDRKMLDEYRRGVDRHILRALEFFGPDVIHKPDFKAVWRQVAKHGNFWYLYRGGWKILQETVRRKVAVELSAEFCKGLVRLRPKAYPDLWAWQEQLIKQVTRQGYVSEPVLGQRRWISQSPTANAGPLASTICNFPPQVSAANLLCDVQMGVRREIRGAKLKALIVLNTFDAIWIDSPLREVPQIERIFSKCLHGSEFWRRLKAATGNTVPLAYESSVTVFTERPDA